VVNPVGAGFATSISDDRTAAGTYEEMMKSYETQKSELQVGFSGTVKFLILLEYTSVGRAVPDIT